jgi:predicted metal-binding membrane protein
MFSPLRPRAPAYVERIVLTACLGTLAGAAWLALWLSEGGGLLHLHHLSREAIARPSFLAGFVFSWTVMTVAMMLPTTLPVVATLHRFAVNRGDRWWLLALAVSGYLAVWGLVGFAAYAGYIGWLHLSGSNAWLAENASFGGPLLLLVAGAFQFSTLKYRCLEKCRSPFSFVVEHWQGRRERWQSLRLGLDHGLYCVGCCWALMLLMFVVGAGNLVWMFLLAAVMATEKNVSWGSRLRAPVGVVLLVWGVVLLAIR